MSTYGNTFRIIRLIRKISLGKAASDLNIDERTLRKIEDGETDVITGRFDIMLEYYQIEPMVIFELAKDKSSFSNVIHTLSGDSTIFNQGQAENWRVDRDERITSLEKKVEILIEADKINKNLIEHLKMLIEQSPKNKS